MTLLILLLFIQIKGEFFPINLGIFYSNLHDITTCPIKIILANYNLNICCHGSSVFANSFRKQIDE